MPNPSPLPDFDSLWDYNDPADTESRFRELLPAAIDSGDRGYQAELMTQIARALGLQRRFPDAHNQLDRVRDLLPKASGRARIRYFLERGRVHNTSGEPAEAAPLFHEAYALARAAGEDNLAVDAAHMIAIVEPTEKQIEWNERALALAEASSDPATRKWLASLYNNLGWTYHDQSNYERALELFQRAQQLREERGDPGLIRIARWAVARALRSLGRLEEAYEMQMSLKDEHEAAGSSDGFVHEELGECLLELGRPEEAKPHFAAAFEILSRDPWLAANEVERLERLRALGM